MKERIFGVETEYALAYRASSGGSVMKNLQGEKLLARMQELTMTALASMRRDGGASAGEFLGNGGRLYMDRGGHPEYATPECRSVADLIAHEKAGDRLIQELFCDTHGSGEAPPSPLKVHVFKNNVDSYGNTYGSHENYLVSQRAYEQLDSILPYLVSRQIYTGAGKTDFDPDSGAVGFQVSQRADFFDRVYSDRTSEVRGIINTRRREIPRQGAGQRLHVILGDSNLCETAMALKTGVTHLVLRVLEEDTWRSLPALRSPVEALKRISRDPETAAELEGCTGRWTALEIQSWCLEKVQAFFAARQPSAEESRILNLWEEILLGLRRLKLGRGRPGRERPPLREDYPILLEDPGYLHRKLDWVLKLWLLNRYAAEGDSSARASTTRRLDILYHDLDPASGLFERCRSLGMVNRVTTDAAIEEAKTTPPEDTRARLRGRIVQLTAARNIDIDIKSWDKIILRAKPKKSGIVHLFNRQWSTANHLTIPLTDPFQAQDDELMENVRLFLDDWA